MGRRLGGHVQDGGVSSRGRDRGTNGCGQNGEGNGRGWDGKDHALAGVGEGEGADMMSARPRTRSKKLLRNGDASGCRRDGGDDGPKSTNPPRDRSAGFHLP